MTITRTALILFSAGVFACHDDAKEANRKAEESRIEADYRAREEMRTADEKARNEQIAADKTKSEHSLSIAKEKAETRTNVEAWLSSLDKYLAELSRGTKDSKLGDDQRALMAYKETLQEDLGAIDRATDLEWPTVKARIDKDIDGAKKRISDLALVAKSKA